MVQFTSLPTAQCWLYCIYVLTVQTMEVLGIGQDGTVHQLAYSTMLDMPLSLLQVEQYAYVCMGHGILRF